MAVPPPWVPLGRTFPIIWTIIYRALARIPGCATADFLTDRYARRHLLGVMDPTQGKKPVSETMNINDYAGVQFKRAGQ